MLERSLVLSNSMSTMGIPHTLGFRHPSSTDKDTQSSVSRTMRREAMVINARLLHMCCHRCCRQGFGFSAIVTLSRSTIRQCGKKVWGFGAAALLRGLTLNDTFAVERVRSFRVWHTSFDLRHAKNVEGSTPNTQTLLAVVLDLENAQHHCKSLFSQEVIYSLFVVG